MPLSLDNLQDRPVAPSKSTSIRPSLRQAIQWIADNDETGETDIAVLETLISVALVADLFGKSTTYVATRVMAVRTNL